MKSINRDEIKRMFNGTGGGSSGGSGAFDPSQLAGYATRDWVNTSFLSKDFFNQIFEIYLKTRVLVKNGDTVISDTTTTSAVTPNDMIPQDSTETDPDTGNVTTTTHDVSIRAKLGLWTDSYLSALGQGSGGGGGGGGSSTLAGLNDVALGQTIGLDDVLTYNGTKWTNTPKSTFLNGYATETWVTNQNYLTSSAISDMATKTWVTNEGFLKASALSVSVSGSTLTITLSGDTYSITDTNTWRPVQDNLTSDSTTESLSAKQGKVLKGYIDTLTSYFDSNGNAKTALKLATARTIWGQSFDGSANISGNMSDVGNIAFSASGKNIGSVLYFDTTVGRLGVMNSSPAFTLDISGTLHTTDNALIGGNYMLLNYANKGLMIEGGITDNDTGETRATFGFHTAGAVTWLNNDYIMQLRQSDTDKYLWVTCGKIRLGDALLTWDSANNAIKVSKMSGTSVVACNLYATGGVSALGMSGGASGSVDELTVNNTITMGVGSRITREATAAGQFLYIGRSDNSGWVGLADMCSQSGDNYWKILTTGEAYFASKVQSPKFYLDNTRYLYLDGSNNLMFFNGTTAKQVAFTN